MPRLPTNHSSEHAKFRMMAQPCSWQTPVVFCLLWHFKALKLSVFVAFTEQLGVEPSGIQVARTCESAPRAPALPLQRESWSSPSARLPPWRARRGSPGGFSAGSHRSSPGPCFCSLRLEAEVPCRITASKKGCVFALTRGEKKHIYLQLPSLDLGRMESRVGSQRGNQLI